MSLFEIVERGGFKDLGFSLVRAVVSVAGLLVGRGGRRRRRQGRASLVPPRECLYVWSHGVCNDSNGRRKVAQHLPSHLRLHVDRASNVVHEEHVRRQALSSLVPRSTSSQLDVAADQPAASGLTWQSECSEQEDEWRSCEGGGEGGSTHCCFRRTRRREDEDESDGKRRKWMARVVIDGCAGLRLTA